MGSAKAFFKNPVMFIKALESTWPQHYSILVHYAPKMYLWQEIDKCKRSIISAIIVMSNIQIYLYQELFDWSKSMWWRCKLQKGWGTKCYWHVWTFQSFSRSQCENIHWIHTDEPSYYFNHWSCVFYNPIITFQNFSFKIIMTFKPIVTASRCLNKTVKWTIK